MNYTQDSYLFTVMKSRLARAGGEIAFDIGCSAMITANMFKSNRYVGFDLQLNRLRLGLARHDLRKNVVGILADMADLDQIPSHSADIVVCTNVLRWPPEDVRRKAIRDMIALTRLNGMLMFNMVPDSEHQETMGALSEAFETVECIRYHNLFTKAYRFVLNRLDRLTGNQRANRLADASGLSKIILSIERYTKHGEYRLYIASQKREPVPDGSFQYDSLPDVDGIYVLSDRALPDGVVRKELSDWRPGTEWAD